MLCFIASNAVEAAEPVLQGLKFTVEHNGNKINKIGGVFLDDVRISYHSVRILFDTSLHNMFLGTSS